LRREEEEEKRETTALPDTSANADASVHFRCPPTDIYI
jgi:hypothetical protein